MTAFARLADVLAARGMADGRVLGLQALMRAAHVDPAIVDTGAVGFRLAPRINAAGRLGHPAAALELLLTDDREEASRAHADQGATRTGPVLADRARCSSRTCWGT